MNMIQEDDPQTNIRTDLWGEMSLQDLLNQQDMVINRLTAVAQLVSHNQSMRGMYAALQHANEVLSDLILNVSNKKKNR